MIPARYLVSSDSHGSATDEKFDGTPALEILPHAALTTISLRVSSEGVTGITVGSLLSIGISLLLINDSAQMHYGAGDLAGVTFGDLYSSVIKYILDPSEYVTMIEGRATYKIHSLTFVTNKRILTTADYDGETWGADLFVGILGTVGVAGKTDRFVWSVADQVPSHLAHRMGLLYFTGSL